VHIKGSKKSFLKWFHGASTHKIDSTSDLVAEGGPITQERMVEIWHRELVDKWKQADQEEQNEQDASDTAEEDAAEESTDEDKGE
jgi:hypothetical protein